MIAFGLIVSLLALMALGVPIGFAMGLSGVLGLWLVGGWDTVVGIVQTAPISAVSHYELVSMPMFVLMAQFIVASRIAERMYDSMVVLVGATRGGLAIATALFGAGFAAIAGSSVVGAATLASTSSPSMLRHGYEPKFANGVVAISGTLGMLLPPSLALIFYSIIADQSVSKMLMAGVVPGLLITLVIILTIMILIWLDPARAPVSRPYTIAEKVRGLRLTGPVLLLVAIIVGSMYFGIVTPTEASAIGAFAAFCIALATGNMSGRAFLEAILHAMRTSAMIAVILIGAGIFGYAMTLTQTTQAIISAIGGLSADRYVVMSLLILFKLALGFFLDQFAILVLTVPILLPIIKDLGFDPVWFGVILVVTAEIGMVTPPLGTNVFVIARYTGRPAEEIFAGVWPHVLAHLLAIVGLVAFPSLVLWLPESMK